MREPAALREVFREDLRSLMKMITEFPSDQMEQLVPELSSVMALPSFRKTQIVEDNPPQELLQYEHLYDLGEFYLSDNFLTAWEKYCEDRNISLIECKAMAHLFLLHEMLHTRQGLSSHKFHDTDFAPNVLHAVDYNADAVSIVACYHLYTYHQMAEWAEDNPQQMIAKLIRAALRGMEIFTSIYGTFPMQKCSQQYFVRYFTWHFQYARVRRWRGSSSTLTESLRCLPLFDIESMPPRFNREQFSTEHLKLFMTLIEPFKPFRIYRYRGDDATFAQNIFDGIATGNCELSSRAFNEILEQYEELLGEVEGVPLETTEPRRVYRESYKTITGFLDAVSRLEDAHDVLEAAQDRRDPVEQVRDYQQRFDETRIETRSRMYEVSDVFREVKKTYKSSPVLEACKAFVDWYHSVVRHEKKAGAGPDSKGQQFLRQILSAMEEEIQTRATTSAE